MSSDNGGPSHTKEKDISDDEEYHMSAAPSLSPVRQIIYSFMVYLTTVL